MILSPLTRRRIANFRANRRGWWSLWIFLAVFFVALGAEAVANDRPLLLSFRNQLYVPVLFNYPETEFGGVLEATADYRDPEVKRLIETEGWMVWPPIRFAADTINYDLTEPAPSPPSQINWLGTDDQARDVLARLIYGLRLSILFSLCLTAISSVIGIVAGGVQGYYGGKIDLYFQRFIEIWSGMPTLYLLIILSSLFTPGFFTILGLMLLFAWMGLVDVVRAESLRARNFDYVRAARALGLGRFTTMTRHVLPNAMTAALTFLPFKLAAGVTTLTSLDFLGLGLPPGSPSLGELVAQAKRNIEAPWLAFTAFLSLSILLTLLTFIGEAVRDAFDPRKGID